MATTKGAIGSACLGLVTVVIFACARDDEAVQEPVTLAQQRIASCPAMLVCLVHDHDGDGCADHAVPGHPECGGGGHADDDAHDGDDGGSDDGADDAEPCKPPFEAPQYWWNKSDCSLKCVDLDLDRICDAACDEATACTEQCNADGKCGTACADDCG
jgi:hypothetical protein